MIVRICLSADGIVKLPKSYNHLLQAFFYRNMDPALSRFLHDIGFVYGKRRFKLFTFSKVIGRLLGKDKKSGLLFFEPQVSLYFASPLMDIVSSSAKTFLRRENLFIGKNKLSLESINIVKPQIEEDITVRCLSPITVYRTPIDGGNRFVYLSPWEEEFYKLLKANLMKKYTLVYGKEYKYNLDIQPVRLSRKHRKKVVYKGTLIEAWEGYFRLKGNKEMLRLALEAGLGAKNSIGFGMIERVL